MGAIIDNFKKKLKSGKYPRSNFWMDVLASYVIAGMFKFLGDMIVTKVNITIVAYIILYIYWIYLEIRRFHDANRPGWWAVMNLIPGLGTIAALLLAGFLKSDYDDNPWCGDD